MPLYTCAIDDKYVANIYGSHFVNVFSSYVAFFNDVCSIIKEQSLEC